MKRRGSDTVAATRAHARERLERARAFVAVAKSIQEDAQRSEFRSVQIGLAVLSGIAAADAICIARLGCHSSGSNHSSAVALLRQAEPNAPALVRALNELIGRKQEAHYGVTDFSPPTVSAALRRADLLIGGAATAMLARESGRPR